ncbi:hypothetical protein Lauda_00043 [Pseudomonas phage vB_PpuM-Lauda]
MATLAELKESVALHKAKCKDEPRKNPLAKDVQAKMWWGSLDTQTRMGIWLNDDIHIKGTDFSTIQTFYWG